MVLVTKHEKKHKEMSTNIFSLLNTFMKLWSQLLQITHFKY